MSSSERSSFKEKHISESVSVWVCEREGEGREGRGESEEERDDREVPHSMCQGVRF